MLGTRRRMLEHGVIRAAVAGMLLVLTVLGSSSSVRADDASDARELVERARYTLERFQADSAMDGFREMMRERARAVLVFPQIVKIGFVLGGAGGTGILMALNPQGNWLGPAFYTFGQVNIGLLAGAEATELVIMALTEKGLTSLLSDTMKWGAEVSGAIGPVGMGAAAASAGLSADLVAYSRGKGLYISFSLDGAYIDVRETLNGAYYGQSAAPIDILVRGEVKNPHAEPLIDLLKKLAAGQK